MILLPGKRMAKNGPRADARRGACRCARGRHLSACPELPASAGRVRRAILARAGAGPHAQACSRGGLGPAAACSVWAGLGHGNDSFPRQLAMRCRAAGVGDPRQVCPERRKEGLLMRVQWQ